MQFKVGMLGVALSLLAGLVTVATRQIQAASSADPVAAERSLVLGTYKFGACDDCEPHFGPAGFDSYAAWLGTDQLKYAQDNIGESYWEFFEQGWPGSFQQWREWKAAAPGRRLVLAVPFFVDAEPGDSAARISACARGDYDDHYAALAANLQAASLGDSILRIAWEAHQDWAPWSYYLNPDDWRTCWRRVAQTVKQVTPTLVTNWNVGDDAGGERSYMREAVELRGIDNFYPGDDVVDEIGIDTYGAPQVTDWGAFFGNDVGSLGWLVQFAEQHGKPVSIPEWGLWDNKEKNAVDGSRDDSWYIERMYEWMTDPTNRVAWAAYFDVNLGQSTNHQLQPDWNDGTVFPQASERFRELFGAL